jgi:hypothetical protein
VTALLIAAGAVAAFYAVMGIVIVASALTREAGERAERWQVSREAADWRASVPPRYRQRWKFLRPREA